MIKGISSNNILNTYQNQIEKKEKIKTTKTSRVEEIKKAIENGTYKIDLEKTAKAMAKNLL